MSRADQKHFSVRSLLFVRQALAGSRPGRFERLLCGAALWASVVLAAAQVPNLLNYQGRLVVGGAPFDGTGQFKLALVNADGSKVYWRNAPDSDNDGEPDQSVAVRVNHGIYSVTLGDTRIENMAVLPPGVFLNSGVYLRAWFNDGKVGFERLAPDQRITTVGYALMAASVADGAVTAANLSPALAGQFQALSNRLAAIEAAAGSGQTVVSTEPRDTNLIAKGFVNFTMAPAPGWVVGPVEGAPSARSEHTALWTGREMLLWGGALAPGAYTAAGHSYRPDQDSWTTVSPLHAPAARGRHSAIWTGSEMIVWGGFSANGYLNSGAKFNPLSQAWQSLPLDKAPSAREAHAAVWTGSHMIIWGGRDGGSLLNDGAIYDPEANRWSPMNFPGAPSPRARASAIETGNAMIIWGGDGAGGALATGAQLTLSPLGLPTGWKPLSALSAPGPRSGHTAVWTGEKMIVWGGQHRGIPLGDGAAYDPVADQWEPLPGENAPAPRFHHTAVWTGQEMIVLGGQTESGPDASGAAFNPATGRWRALNSAGGPLARSSATAVWSGGEVLVFGGLANDRPLGALQRLSPQPAWYFYRKL